MIFEIDGVDFASYIAYGGFQWQRSDVDGPNAGRDLLGEMHRDRVAVKYRGDITCRLLNDAERAKMLAALEPEFVTVRYSNPYVGVITQTMYSNNITCSHALNRPDGSAMWAVSFPMITR